MRNHALLVIFSVAVVNAQFSTCLGPFAGFGAPSRCPPLPNAGFPISPGALLQQRCGFGGRGSLGGGPCSLGGRPCSLGGGPGSLIGGPNSLGGGFGGVVGNGAAGPFGGAGFGCSLDDSGNGGGIYALGGVGPVTGGASAQEGGCSLSSGVSEPVQGSGECSICQLGTYGAVGRSLSGGLGVNSKTGVNPAGSCGMVPYASRGESPLGLNGVRGLGMTGQGVPGGVFPISCPYCGSSLLRTYPLGGNGNVNINAGLTPSSCGVPFDDPSLSSSFLVSPLQGPGYVYQLSNGPMAYQGSASSELNSGNGRRPTNVSCKYEQPGYSSKDNCQSSCSSSKSKSLAGRERRDAKKDHHG